MFFIINVYIALKKRKWEKKTEDLSAVLSLHNMPQFSIRYCSNGLDTNSSKSGFLTISYRYIDISFAMKSIAVVCLYGDAIIVKNRSLQKS